MIRYGAARVADPHSALVGSVIQIDWDNLALATETVREMVREFADYDSRHYADNVVIPLVLAGMKVAPDRLEGPLGGLLDWSLRRGSRPPFGTVLRLEMEGPTDRLVLQLAHEDGYELTAIPVVAWLLTMANTVEPERFLADLERMGVSVSTA